MRETFVPDGRPMLIGSQPLNDHNQALDLVMTYMGEIPNWVQLPTFPQEGMVAQFADGLPGLITRDNKLWVDNAASNFEEDLLVFFQDYLSTVESGFIRDDSRFALTPRNAGGFFALLNHKGTGAAKWIAVKGQVTGPITMCTAIKDQQGRAVLYHDSLREAAVKLIAMKAAWQIGKLRAFGVPTIMFIDEPALAGYGSSELISVSEDQIANALREVIDAIHEFGGLAGVHVCANTDWSILLASEVDIINFDAYGFFDRFILYEEGIKTYLDSGRFLAWGLVPTLQIEDVERIDIEFLWRVWEELSQRLIVLGIDRDTLRRQSFITPSCGTGSLPADLSRKVLVLTREISLRIRETTI